MFESTLSPLTNLLATLLAGVHHVVDLTGLSDGHVWFLSIMLFTCVIRLAILPLAIHGAKISARSRVAAPKLAEIRTKYKDKKDPEDLKAMLAEQRAVQAEHNIGCAAQLPTFLQLPIFLSVFHLIRGLSAGKALGALTTAVVATAGATSFAGLALGTTFGTDLPLASQAAILLVGFVSAFLTYAALKWFNFAPQPSGGSEIEDAMATVFKMMPMLAAAGVFSAIFFVPFGLVLYWFTSNLWTFVQQGVLKKTILDNAPAPTQTPQSATSDTGSTDTSKD